MPWLALAQFRTPDLQNTTIEQKSRPALPHPIHPQHSSAWSQDSECTWEAVEMQPQLRGGRRERRSTGWAQFTHQLKLKQAITSHQLWVFSLSKYESASAALCWPSIFRDINYLVMQFYITCNAIQLLFTAQRRGLYSWPQQHIPIAILVPD